MGQKAGHARFLDPAARTSEEFEESTHRIRQGKGDTGRNRGNAHLGQEIVNPRPEDHGILLADKKSLTGRGGCGLQISCRQEVGVDHVVDIGDIHTVAAGSDNF